MYVNLDPVCSPLNALWPTKIKSLSGNACTVIGAQTEPLAFHLADTSALSTAVAAVLSPVGLVDLFRQYFFEFDSFLGAPVGHLWISPGGTVEVIESSTRKTLIEKTLETFEESTRTSEESLTEQDEIADAVKEENSSDTKLGASASGGAEFVGIAHAEASASFSSDTSRKKSSEVTHKHARTQSAKVTSQIRRNFKTTFRTVTETTDTTSRRYVVQNTSNRLVNYDLRRKMRKVGVQLQHLRTAMVWQDFMEDPGKALGLGQLIHIVEAPDLSALKKPDNSGTILYPDNQPVSFQPTGSWNYGEDPQPGPFILIGTTDPPPSPPGFEPIWDDPAKVFPLSQVSAQGTDFTGHWAFGWRWTADKQKIQLGVVTDSAIEWDKVVTFVLTGAVWFQPTAEKKKEIDDRNAANKAAYDDYLEQVDALNRKAYLTAVRERSKLVRSVPQRPAADLRAEERHLVYGHLINKLHGDFTNSAQLKAEYLREIFDVDEMLYFVAPDYWRPGKIPPIGPDDPTKNDYQGRYPVPATHPPSDQEIKGEPLTDGAVTSSYTHPSKNRFLAKAATAAGDMTVGDEWRLNYPITEDSHPAPLGSSLGWLIQIDGDARRNQFLNAAWVKAVLPIRPGQEVEALALLKRDENEGKVGLEQSYKLEPGDPQRWAGKHSDGNTPWTYGQVLDELAEKLKKENTELNNTLAADKVFENGFDPLDGGFRPAAPYQVFDQWIEVLPTDQVVAVEVTYDPKTGQLS